ncbi:MAG: thiamine biosynthesis protein ThiF [Sulfurimonas sp.]|nr:thiamine biosynthesis protein ThiF [Sulfurimonas sp.]
MTHGSRISCVGIVGDGCGGGREFIVENEILFAYDPQTGENIILLKNIHMPKAISKNECIITIKCEKEEIKFDLSALKKV